MNTDEVDEVNTDEVDEDDGVDEDDDVDAAIVAKKRDTRNRSSEDEDPENKRIMIPFVKCFRASDT